MTDYSRHESEAAANLAAWKRKPLLRQIYKDFHRRIAAELATGDGLCVELGSGISNIQDVIPHCVRTDLFPAPGLDAIENAYRLSFANGAVQNLILFDVFHHLAHPGTALAEFQRVLTRGGRLILFEPCVSVLGRIVFGAMHPEPLGLKDDIQWEAPDGFDPDDAPYYAAQGNAWRLFVRNDPLPELSAWRLIANHRLAAISYVASGGYSGPQLYPTAALGLMRSLDRLLGFFPGVFATRLLVVLEKQADS